MKKLLFILLMFIFCSFQTFAQYDHLIGGWEIEGKSVLVNNTDAFIKITPHTVHSHQPVYIDLTSKQYTGNVTVFFSFNMTETKPKSLDVYKPKNITVQKNTTIYNVTSHESTTLPCEIGDNDSTYHRLVHYNGNSTVCCFDSYITEGNDYTIFWDEIELREWLNVNSYMNSFNKNFIGMDKWYYRQNVPIVAGETLKLRMYLDITENGKYGFGAYPSFYGQDIQLAADNNHLYYLDPWYNSSNWISYWSHDDADVSGATSLDSIGSNNGTIDGATTGATGQVNQAFSFDGTNDKVTISTFNAFNSLDEYSMSAWIYPDSTTTATKNTIISQWGSNTGWMCTLAGKTTGKFTILDCYSGCDTSATSVTFDFLDDTWYHIGFTFNDTTDDGILKVYVNGSEEASTTDTGRNACFPSDDLNIGARSDEIRYFKGKIDEVALWTDALTPSEINQIYECGVNGTRLDECISSTPSDTTAPIVTLTSIGGDSSSPYSGIDLTPSIIFDTDENAYCKYSTTNQSYDSMSNQCTVGEGTTTHNCTFSTLTVGDNNLYIACNDESGNNHTTFNNYGWTYTALCDANSDCDANQFCNSTQLCQSDLADGTTCVGVTYEGTTTAENNACTSGYCDNDGVGAADDNWCFTPFGSFFDGEEPTKCEYSASSQSIYSDEYAVNTTFIQCNLTGETYFSDYVNSTCGISDNTTVCRSSTFNSTCTADSQCNDVVPGTNYCLDNCTYSPNNGTFTVSLLNTTNFNITNQTSFIFSVNISCVSGGNDCGQIWTDVKYDEDIETADDTEDSVSYNGAWLDPLNGTDENLTTATTSNNRLAIMNITYNIPADITSATQEIKYSCGSSPVDGVEQFVAQCYNGTEYIDIGLTSCTDNSIQHVNISIPGECIDGSEYILHVDASSGSDPVSVTTKFYEDIVYWTSSGNSVVIPEDTGDPLFVNSTIINNPYNSTCTNLTAGNYCQLNWSIFANSSTIQTKSLKSTATSEFQSAESSTVNVTIESQTTPASDSCSNCDGTADCVIQCNDNCLLDSNIDMGGFDILFNGTGTPAITSQVNITSQITNTGDIKLQNACWVKIYSGGRIG